MVQGPALVIPFVGVMLPVCRVRDSPSLVRLEEPHRDTERSSALRTPHAIVSENHPDPQANKSDMR